MSEEKESNQTKIVRQKPRNQDYFEHSPSIYLTSSFEFSSAEEIADTFAQNSDHFVYSRYANPNLSDLIKKVSELEGMETGFATSSGMSAIFTTLLSFLDSGDHLLCSESIFGSTYQLVNDFLPKKGIETTFVPLKEIDDWKDFIRPNTKAIFLETPSNPGLELIDLKKACDFAKKFGLISIVDNCFATPIIQKPKDFGADVIIHSATKFLDGQGRVLGGLILTSHELAEKIQFLIRHSGPAMSPFNAWILSKSLDTLQLRMERHCENALFLATELEGNDKLSHVVYPYLPSHPQYNLAIQQMKMGGGILSLRLKGDRSTCFKFINGLKLFSITSNLGDSRSIVTHPSSTTHSKLDKQIRDKMGIQESLIRLSIGLEDKEDLLQDIFTSLGKL